MRNCKCGDIQAERVGGMRWEESNKGIKFNKLLGLRFISKNGFSSYGLFIL